MKKKETEHSPVTPPRWANRFLKWFCAPDLLDEVEGDLYEMFFVRVEKYGLKKARRIYMKEVLLFCKPTFFKQLKPTLMSSLFKNYIKITARNLFRQKGYSVINIGGLAIALAVTFLMLLWVQDEWNIDKFHANGDRIFLLKRTIPQADGTIAIENMVPLQLLQAAQDELPEVERFIPFGRDEEMTLNSGEKNFRAKGSFANASYFESLSFPILAGGVKDLDEKQSAPVKIL